MSKQGKRVTSWSKHGARGQDTHPKAKVPPCKPFACLILLKVCFSVLGRFVVSGWFCHLLPEMHLISLSFQRWCSPGEASYCASPACGRNICGLDWQEGRILVLCPWALRHLQIHTWIVTVRSHPLRWGRGVITTWSECCGLNFSPLYWRFAFFFWFMDIFFLPLVSKRKKMPWEICWKSLFILLKKNK